MITPKLDSMRALYLEQLRDLHDAESQLVEALPRVAEAAHNGELKVAIQEHLEVTLAHVARLDDILAQLEESPGRSACKGMVGLVMEASQAIDADADPRVRDAAIIAAAQRIEHYEIAGYGCAAAFAELLDEQQAADQLRAMLGEEKEADEALSELARGSINIEAARASEEMEPDHEADAGPATRR